MKFRECERRIGGIMTRLHEKRPHETDNARRTPIPTAMHVVVRDGLALFKFRSHPHALNCSTFVSVQSVVTSRGHVSHIFLAQKKKCFVCVVSIKNWYIIFLHSTERYACVSARALDLKHEPQRVSPETLRNYRRFRNLISAAWYSGAKIIRARAWMNAHGVVSSCESDDAIK